MDYDIMYKSCGNNDLLNFIVTVFEKSFLFILLCFDIYMRIKKNMLPFVLQAKINVHTRQRYQVNLNRNYVFLDDYLLYLLFSFPLFRNQTNLCTRIEMFVCVIEVPTFCCPHLLHLMEIDYNASILTYKLCIHSLLLLLNVSQCKIVKLFF